MNKTGKILVVKRDGQIEDFNCTKIARMLTKAFGRETANFHDAMNISAGMEMYLQAESVTCVTSSAIFDLALCTLDQFGFTEQMQKLKSAHDNRNARRDEITTLHNGGRINKWDKNLLCSKAIEEWNLSRQASRDICAVIEDEIIDVGIRQIPWSVVLEMLNLRISGFGLADAVPVSKE